MIPLTGFYILDRAIPIPKLIVCPLTLGFFVGLSCLVCTRLEKAYRAFLKRRDPNISREQILHHTFSICTFAAFNIFFIYGGRPEILRCPVPVQLLFNFLVAFVSGIWLHRTWNRSAQQYLRESLSHSFRYQLQKLRIDLSQFLGGRHLEQLKADELHVLAKVLPNVTQQERWKVYKGVVQDALEEGRFEPSQSLEALKSTRQKLNLNDENHYQILEEISCENPHILYPQYPGYQKTSSSH